MSHLEVLNIVEASYLIIGGTTKAGTTSLYKYLSSHPAICPSSLKETRFFLDANYPLPSTARFNGNNIESYGGFFCCCSAKKVRMEATPDYLYSEMALRIPRLLPKAKIVFILRDPIERLESWYKFAKQRGLLKNSETFDEYVRSQIDAAISPSTPIHLRALEQGRYEYYLSRFKEKFSDRILVVGFDELKNDPRSLMKKICKFVDIDDSYYETYNYSVENMSMSVKWQWIERCYLTARRNIAFYLHDNTMAKRVLKGPNKILKRMLEFNKKSAGHVAMSPQTRKLLEEYYLIREGK